MTAAAKQVAVIGGGIIGCAVAHALARRGVAAVLLEADAALALGASGANSGILHTGFDSTPGELETRLILRAAELREELLDELGVAVWRCGAVLAPRDADERLAVGRLAQNARENGVEARVGADGALSVPGESVTDPVAFVRALAGAAQAGGTTLRLRTRVTGLAAHAGEGLVVELGTGEPLHADAAVNCAGLHADAIARSTGEDLVEVYPRKGEFLVFAAPDGSPLEEILLPVPSALGKGVLVFPTVDRRAVIAGPTARERDDKHDWSVEPDASELIVAKARRMYPALEDVEPIGAYAGLRPAGRNANYVIERSRTLPGLVHVAAIRSTGLSASVAIGEHVVGMLAEDGAIAPGPVRALPSPSPSSTASPAGASPGTGESASPQTWWERAARRSAAPSSASSGTPELP
jgi:glycerol-3-phosphate dehydrogenase